MELLYNLEPTGWSRNFDEEEIDEIELIEPQPIRFEKLVESSLEASLLLVAAKPAAACLLHAQFPNKTKIGSVIIPELHNKKRNISSKSSINGINLNDYSCDLYRDSVDASRLLLVCHSEISPDRASEFAKCVLVAVSAKDVVVFDTLLDWKYNATAPERAAPPFLRKLETDATRESGTNKDSCAYLESPNLIDSLGAALISRRQMQNQPCRVYISLEASRILDVDTIVAFEQALKHVTGQETSGATLALYKQMLSSMQSRRPSPLFL